MNKPGSWKDDKSRWKNHVANENHNTPAGVRSILDSKRLTNLAPATRKQILQLIHKVYNWHIQNGRWSRANPAAGITLPTKFDNRVNNILPPDQLSLFIDSVESYHNQHAARLILFAVYTGRRFSEIANLTWSDLSEDKQFITCKHTKNSLTLSFPLSEQAVACIPPRPEIVDNTAESRPTGAYIFPSPSGKHYGNNFRKTWSRVKLHLYKEGIMDIRDSYRFHDLRHQYASAMAGKIDIYLLQRLLGHSDIKLTMRYAHLSDTRLQGAVNQVTIP